nr:delta-5 fatty acid desaturase [Apocyclops royi]
MSEVPEGQIRIEDKVYSAEKLSKLHPGGPVFIKAFSGRDASQAFLSYHRRNFPHGSKPAKESFLLQDKSIKYTTKDNDDFLDLCSRVEKILPRSKAFAPWHYYLKAIIILGAAFSLEFYIHFTGSYIWYLTAVLGFVFALIGLNIQHDANHGTISRRAWVNRLFGKSQNWIGGSTVSWIHQHVVQHHVHTNDLELDPDIAIEFYIRLNPRHPLLKFHVFQYIYFFLIAALFGLQKIMTSLGDVLSWHHYTPIANELRKYAWEEWIFTVVYIIRWVVLPFFMVAPGQAVNYVFSWVVMNMVMGYYLSFFFTISHNFEGVEKHEDTRRPVNAHKSFLYNQVAASSNVAGFWLAILNGGLNYQIEHHLFPRINHTHYYYIAPVVRQFCEERKIPYTHFESVPQNVRALVQHLAEMGSNKNFNIEGFVNPSEKVSAKMHIVS